MNYKKTVSQLKTEIRLNIKNRLKKFSLKQRTKKSIIINQKVKLFLKKNEFKTLCIFIPTINEPDINIKYLLNTYTQLFCPKFIDETYIFSKFENIEHLKIGKFNIKETTNSTPISETELLSKKTIFLIPMLGFDTYGCRLGYGNGYYDRLLKSTKGLKIGVGFSFQEYTQLPLESHDIKLDYVITEKKLVNCNNKIKIPC